MKRKRIKGQEQPVRCSFCRKQTAFHRLVGTSLPGYGYCGGMTCCDDCFKQFKQQERQERNHETMSCGEEQAFHLFKI